MAKSLLLDQSAWDLVLDASGSIAIADDPYALAQNVATAVRTFLGEVYYDTSIGVPYFQQILGQYPSVQRLRSLLAKAALTVPGVVTATVFLTALQGRQLGGQIQVATATGQTATVTVPIVSGSGQLDFTDPLEAIWTTV